MRVKFYMICFIFKLSICKQSVHNLGTNNLTSISSLRTFHSGICCLKVFVRTGAASLTWVKLSIRQTLHPLWFQLMLLQMSEMHHICVKNRCISVSQLHEYSIAGVICASVGYPAFPHFFDCRKVNCFLLLRMELILFIVYMVFLLSESILTEFFTISCVSCWGE